MKTFSVNDVTYSPANPLIVAEIGTGHGGSLDKACALVDKAAEAGAGCVKTQIVYAREILHAAAGEVPLPGGDINLYEAFKRLEQDAGFYTRLKTYTEAKGLLFLATPFGHESAGVLRGMKPAFVKIASPELNYVQLLSEVAAWNVPVILSTGVSTLSDIETAASCFPPGAMLCLLHCVTAYPAPEADYNLSLLPGLGAIFGNAVGVSDHSLDPCLVPNLALTQGACVIEKHFCLSQRDAGLDDPIALEPEAFAQMSRSVMETSAKLAAGRADEVVRAYERKYGAGLVRAVLVDGRKTMKGTEAANYGRTNRSIHAVRDIAAGEVITKDNIAVLRTEKILRPGLPPASLEQIVGRKAASFIPAGEGIRFEDL
jgi:sialic acid synthase SpsE